MRIHVEGVGYGDASALLHDGNRWAAFHFSHLGDELTGTAAMAGDSSFATTWAASYDEAAASLVRSYADAVGALGSLGRFAFASLENHTRAERASVIGGPRLVDLDAMPSMLTDDWVDVLPLAPPTSLGGDPSSLPGWATTILDHVEGFVWPDADVDRLRAAAGTWRSAAGSLADLATYPRRAVGELLTELSPEVLPATAAIGRAAGAIEQLGAGCADLGRLCDEYADEVEAHRQAVLDLASDLMRDAVLIQAAGFLAGFVTLGTTNGGALAINAAKIAAAAPRFKRILDTLRLYGQAAAQSLQGTRYAVAGAGARLRPMADARLLMTAEVGQVGAKAAGRLPSFLARHEGGPMKAHTMRKHVGKSDAYLRARLRADKRKQFVSTFDDAESAEAAITSVLGSRARRLQAFLASTKRKTTLEAPVENIGGRVMDRDGNVSAGSGVLLHLAKDDSMPEGYRIITTYITP